MSVSNPYLYLKNRIIDGRVTDDSGHPEPRTIAVTGVEEATDLGFGTCFEFDGQASFRADLPCPDAFTFAMWVRREPLYSGRYYSLIEFGDNRPQFGFSGASLYLGNGPSAPLPYREWHHVAITYDPAPDAPDAPRSVLYIDGAQVSTGAGAVTTSGSGLRIGDGLGVKNYPFPGRMAHVLIYDRALTADEIGQVQHMTSTGIIRPRFSLRDSLSEGVALVEHEWPATGLQVSGVVEARDDEFGSCLEFSDNAYLRAPVECPDACSLALWVKRRPMQSAARHALLAFGHESTALDHFPRLCLDELAPRLEDGPWLRARSPAALPADTWSHVTVTFDTAVGESVLYIDGAEVDRTGGTVRTQPGTRANGLWIGRDRVQGRTLPFVGRMAHILVYDRVLTADDVQRLLRVTRKGTTKPLLRLTSSLQDGSDHVHSVTVRGEVDGRDATSADMLLDEPSAAGVISFPDSSRIDVAMGCPDAFTFALWVRRGEMASGVWHSLLEFDDNRPQFCLSNLAPRVLDGTVVGARSSTTLELDAWHHLALTYDPAPFGDGGGGVRPSSVLYIDGQAVDEKVGALDTRGSHLQIGRGQGGAENVPFNGRMAHVIVYDRALDQAAVQALVDTTAPQLTSGLEPLRPAMLLTDTTRLSEGLVPDDTGGPPARSTGVYAVDDDTFGPCFELDGRACISLPDRRCPSSFTLSAWVKPSLAEQSTLMTFGEAGPSLQKPWNQAVDAWHHVAITFDPVTAKSTEYFDGAWRASRSHVAPTDPLGLLIGRNAAGVGFRGRLASVAVHSTALSGADVSRLYAAPPRREALEDIGGAVVSLPLAEQSQGNTPDEAAPAREAPCAAAVVADARFGTALRFESGHDAIAIPELQRPDAFTFAAYVHIDGALLEQTATLMKAADSPRPHLMLSDGRLAIDGGPMIDIPVQAEAWCHVALTYDSRSQVATLFVNGERAASGVAAPGAAGVGVYIGGCGDSAAEGVDPFIGCMRHVRIYDRPLPREAIRALIEATRGTATSGDDSSVLDGALLLGDGAVEASPWHWMPAVIGRGVEVEALAGGDEIGRLRVPAELLRTTLPTGPGDPWHDAAETIDALMTGDVEVIYVKSSDGARESFARFATSLGDVSRLLEQMAERCGPAVGAPTGAVSTDAWLELGHSMGSTHYTVRVRTGTEAAPAFWFRRCIRRLPFVGIDPRPCPLPPTGPTGDIELWDVDIYGAMGGELLGGGVEWAFDRLEGRAVVRSTGADLGTLEIFGPGGGRTWTNVLGCREVMLDTSPGQISGDEGSRVIHGWYHFGNSYTGGRVGLALDVDEPRAPFSALLEGDHYLRDLDSIRPPWPDRGANTSLSRLRGTLKHPSPFEVHPALLETVDRYRWGLTHLEGFVAAAGGQDLLAACPWGILTLVRDSDEPRFCRPDGAPTGGYSTSSVLALLVSPTRMAWVFPGGQFFSAPEPRSFRLEEGYRMALLDGQQSAVLTSWVRVDSDAYGQRFGRYENLDLVGGQPRYGMRGDAPASLDPLGPGAPSARIELLVDFVTDESHVRVSLLESDGPEWTLSPVTDSGTSTLWAWVQPLGMGGITLDDVRPNWGEGGRRCLTGSAVIDARSLLLDRCTDRDERYWVEASQPPPQRGTFEVDACFSPGLRVGFEQETGVGLLERALRTQPHTAMWNHMLPASLSTRSVLFIPSTYRDPMVPVELGYLAQVDVDAAGTASLVALPFAGDCADFAGPETSGTLIFGCPHTWHFDNMGSRLLFNPNDARARMPVWQIDLEAPQPVGPVVLDALTLSGGLWGPASSRLKGHGTLQFDGRAWTFNPIGVVVGGRVELTYPASVGASMGTVDIGLAGSPLAVGRIRFVPRTRTVFLDGTVTCDVIGTPRLANATLQYHIDEPEHRITRVEYRDEPVFVLTADLTTAWPPSHPTPGYILRGAMTLTEHVLADGSKSAQGRFEGIMDGTSESVTPGGHLGTVICEDARGPLAAWTWASPLGFDAIQLSALSTIAPPTADHYRVSGHATIAGLDIGMQCAVILPDGDPLGSRLELSFNEPIDIEELLPRLRTGSGDVPFPEGVEIDGLGVSPAWARPLADEGPALYGYLSMPVTWRARAASTLAEAASIVGDGLDILFDVPLPGSQPVTLDIWVTDAECACQITLQPPLGSGLVGVDMLYLQRLYTVAEPANHPETLLARFEATVDGEVVSGTGPVRSEGGEPWVATTLPDRAALFGFEAQSSNITMRFEPRTGRSQLHGDAHVTDDLAGVLDLTVFPTAPQTAEGRVSLGAPRGAGSLAFALQGERTGWTAAPGWDAVMLEAIELGLTLAAGRAPAITLHGTARIGGIMSGDVLLTED